MKILFVYLLLCGLELSVIVFLDLLSGMSIYSSIQAILATFRITTTEESIAAVFLLSAPVILAVVELFKTKRKMNQPR